MGLTNNDIFKKLRVANKLTNDDIVEICALVGFRVTSSELGAIFRREEHPKYMECGDQLLRNFLDGLIIYKRGPKPKPDAQAKKDHSKKDHAKKDYPKRDYAKKGQGKKEFGKRDYDKKKDFKKKTFKKDFDVKKEKPRFKYEGDPKKRPRVPRNKKDDSGKEE